VPASAPGDLDRLHRIGLAVHRAVRDAIHSPQRAEVIAMGADGSPTEQLDRVAEAAVVSMLETLKVDWNVVSEEAGRIERGGDLTLVVDPVDGTSNAVRHLPYFTVSLALGRDTLSSVEIGLLRDLERGVTYWAERGRGAFRDGERLHVRPWKGRGELVLANLGAVASPRAVGLVPKVRRVRALGCASFELALVAEGAADGYLFENAEPHRNLRATDIAAAYRILLEAGGGVSDARGGALDGFPLDVTSRTTVAAWGDRALGERLIAGGAA
jgi:fructose-1,6-bisphosphatase/inositol monophosphatase family enzyme